MFGRMATTATTARFEAAYLFEAERLNDSAAALASHAGGGGMLHQAQPAPNRDPHVVGVPNALEVRIPSDTGFTDFTIPTNDQAVLRSWALTSDFTTLAVVLGTQRNDKNSLHVYRLVQGAATAVHENENVSASVFNAQGQLVWISRDESERPHAVEVWDHSTGVHTAIREDDPRFRLSILSADGDRVLVASNGNGTTEITLLTLERSQADALAPRSLGHQFSGALLDEQVVLLDKNEQEVVSFSGRCRVVLELPPDFIPTGLSVRDGQLCVRGRSRGDDAIWIPAHGSRVWTAPLGGRIATSRVDDEGADLIVTSPIHETQTRRVHATEGWQDRLLTRDGLTAERTWVAIDESVSVPITLFRSDHEPPTPRGLLAIVYGCYGATLDATYDPLLEQLIRAGVTVALCHVRGGGELGPTWHQAARGESKATAVSDFTGCLNHLRSLDYVDPSRIGVLAASAGAAIATTSVLKTPEPVRAMQLVHPFLTPEMILSDPERPLAASDWAEFGDPRSTPSPIAAVSPLAAIRAHRGIGDVKVWIRAGAHDYKAPLEAIRVWATEAAEIAHALQYETPSIVLEINDHGHAGGRDAKEAAMKNAIAMAWLIDQLTT